MSSYEPSLKTIWGLAKSKELQMTDEELHLLVSGRTGKDSLKKLTQKEIRFVVSQLQNMKDSVKRSSGRKDSFMKGNQGTVRQRKKIYKLCEELGWDAKRSNGFAKRMFKIDCVEWLGYEQCSNMIEALKQMVERKEDKEDARSKELRSAGN